MAAIEDRVTISERYSSATESSNLKVKGDTRGDADMLIAAGWLADRLGALLFRLHTEFDIVRAELRAPAALSPTDRMLLLMRLKTLDETKVAMGRFAVQQATKRRFMQPDRVVMQIVGRVLDVHLDSLCHHCDGRGFLGGQHRGEKQTICRPCRGSGHRRDQVGRNEREREFAAFLMAEMDRVRARASKDMGRTLQTNPAPA